MTRHHPSSIASPNTAIAGDLDGISPYARKALEGMIRTVAIRSFSEQHEAPPSPDNWDADLKMMFAIQHPGVKLS